MLLFPESFKICMPWVIFRAQVPLPLRPDKLRPFLFRYASSDTLRNEHINSACKTTVRVVNDRGKLSRSVPLSYVLDSIERKTHYVDLVNKAECIVKVIDGRTAYTREKLQKKTAKKTLKSKEVQIAWTVNENDKTLKIKEAQRHLQKGHTVDLIFAHKKGAPIPSPATQNAMVDSFVQSLSDYAKEYKERMMDRLAATVYLKGSDNAES